MIVRIDWDLIPWKDLHAHTAGNWRGKASATKKLRKAVGMMICTRKERFDRAEIRLSFFMPDARNRDTLNMAQSMKPAIDALVDQGILPEDNWTKVRIGPMHVEVNRADPRVEIQLIQAAPMAPPQS